jgi:sugar phosphate isomerase/epimerase
MVPGITTIAFRNTPLYLEEILPKVSAAGFKQLEVWGGHIEERDDNEMPVIAELAERHNLTIPMVSCYLGTFDLAMTNKGAELRKACFAAMMGRLLGVRYLRAFAGYVMECSSRDASDAYWAYCMDGLREIARIAHENGLTIAVETHKLTLADTIKGCQRIIKEAGDLPVKFILQLDGPAETEHLSPVDVWKELKEHVVHFHQKPESAPYPVRILRGLFDKMREDGYKGAVSIEAAHPDVKPEPVLKRGMELLRTLGVVS